MTSLIGSVMVLEVEGCRSSVVRALVAKAGGSGFDSQPQLRFFFHILPLLLLSEKVSI